MPDHAPTFAAGAALAAVLFVGGAHAADSDAAARLVTDGKVSLDFRYRYEFVDDEAFTEEAHASTLRSRLTLQSGTWEHFSFLVEFDDLREVFADDFNAGEGNTPGRAEYPVVADPEGTGLNQAYVDFRGLPGTTLRVGRQRINLDNQRFVGGVGWRQNEQTYDAASLAWDRDAWHLFYAFVDGVERVFGDDVPAGEHDQDGTHLLNVRWDAPAVGALTGYWYGIDNDDAPGFSTDTFGLRLAGRRDVDPVAVRYAAEIARQRDAGDNPASFDASYWTLEGGVIAGPVDFGVGWEVLEGNADSPGEAFRTPLATLHGFNGWVDKFLVTPDEGLDDRHVKFKGTFGRTLVELRFHRFEGEDSGSKLGEEWNVQVGYAFDPRLRADFVFGDFAGSDPRYQDTTKAWLMVTARLP